MTMLRLLCALVLSLVCGCSTTSSVGRSAGTNTERASRTDVLLPTDIVEEDNQEYIPPFVAVLRKHGFNPVSTGKPRYSTALHVGGSFSIKSTLTLYDAGVPVVTARSSNPGFGTWLARGVVKSSLFRSSLEKFDVALGQLKR